MFQNAAFAIVSILYSKNHKVSLTLPVDAEVL